MHFEAKSRIPPWVPSFESPLFWAQNGTQKWVRVSRKKQGLRTTPWLPAVFWAIPACWNPLVASRTLACRAARHEEQLPDVAQQLDRSMQQRAQRSMTETCNNSSGGRLNFRP